MSLERSPNSKLIPIAFQTKWSHTNSTKSLAKKEVLDAKDKSEEFLKSLGSNSYLVVCAWRDVQKQVLNSPLKKILVLDREKLQDLYSPTLATRPQFFDSLKQIGEQVSDQAFKELGDVTFKPLN